MFYTGSNSHTHACHYGCNDLVAMHSGKAFSVKNTWCLRIWIKWGILAGSTINLPTVFLHLPYNLAYMLTWICYKEYNIINFRTHLNSCHRELHCHHPHKQLKCCLWCCRQERIRSSMRYQGLPWPSGPTNTIHCYKIDWIQCQLNQNAIKVPYTSVNKFDIPAWHDP